LDVVGCCLKWLEVVGYCLDVVGSGLMLLDVVWMLFGSGWIWLDFVKRRFSFEHWCMKFLRNLLWLTVLSFLWSGCLSGDSDQPTPNILFIMSDDHTAQAWGIYGGILQDYVRNDNIRRLAREGARLNRVYCTNSICVPSRASIMTGRYSHQNGIYTLSEGLHPDSSNVARELQQAGYQTALIGKWHLKEKPSGFDYFQILPGQGRYHNPVFLTDQHWEEGEVLEGFSADLIGDLSLRWLEERDPEKPFFLMCHFKATHEPFDYLERYDSLYAGVSLPEPESLYDFGPETTGRSFTGQQLEILGRRWENDQKGMYPGTPFSLAGLDDKERRSAIYQKFVKDFLRCGATIDDNIGKLLEYLDQNNLTENTVVIYTADQGYFLGEHGFFDKRMFYEEAIRMPFVIRYPPEISPGFVNDDLILNLDFPVLFLDYAGVVSPSYMQGRSFRENVRGDTPPDWRTDFYYRYWLHQTNRPAHFGVRNDRYKLIFFYGQPLGMPGSDTSATQPAWEFYDLLNDPHELQNAYRDPDYQGVIDAMKNRISELKAAVGDTDDHFPVMDKIISANW
jgi:arylsulfatase A-like enzyme